ncbi:hypothetical protein HYDPIDRAFT_133047 [Hydnomerulius pinastri MD-312]|uniref:21S rRNA pseudouridine(2819) synthase n=1 Tax=Hydnomerulius pinastri MD-312 TaxID=994086 RepID=A0A0C9W0L2_9AGAM|nr:hypothetical protein HYDPIDRAFT_133047 [Hydnomerulius pinastri MD-312]
MLRSFKRAPAVVSKDWSRLAIYADRSIIVLNKPPYLICQGSQDADVGTDEKPRDRDADKFNDLLEDLRGHFHLEKIPHAVHRLDKATTGALVLAKNLTAARQLSQQFQNRTIGKTYLALVRGGEKSFPARSGEIRDAIESINGRVSISQSCNAKFAATDWELIASSPKAPVSLLRLTLHTGLKHQLLVCRTPGLSTFVWTANMQLPRAQGSLTDIRESRMFLHASRLSLTRFRKTGPNKRFRLDIAAALPGDFVSLCKDVGIPLNNCDVSGGLFIDGEPAGSEILDLEGKWLRPTHRTLD